MGRYLNPRIWNVDLKMCMMWNVGILAHLTVCAVIFIEAYQREKMNAAMILMVSYTIVITLMLGMFQVRQYGKFYM